MKSFTEVVINFLLKNERLTLLTNRAFYLCLCMWYFRFDGKSKLLWQVMPYTMVGYKRLSFFLQLCEEIDKKNLEGAYVECGVWKGGSAAVIASAVKKSGKTRYLHLFDSWEGLPAPSDEDGVKGAIYAEHDTSGELKTIKKTVASTADVEEILFGKLGLNPDRIKLHKGWFQDTLPATKNSIGKIALLHIDADWYKSVKYVLSQLYDRVIPEGYIVIDDYGQWPGCKRAVDEFLLERHLSLTIHKIDYSGVYFNKPPL